MDCNKVLEFISNLWNNIFIKVLVSTLVFILLWWLSTMIVNKTKKRALKRGKTDKLITIVIFNCILWGIRIFLVIVYASVVGIDTAGLAALVASAGVAIGLAIQGSLSNLAGGIVLILTRPFKLDDYIEASGVSGTVEDITMRHTIIRTINNRRIIIPNGQLNSYTIENFNYSDNENMKLVDFTVSYESDVDKAMNIIKEEMKKMYHPNPKGKNKDVEFPKVRVASWNDSSITLRAWVWGKDNSETFENMYNLNYIIKKRFDKEGIEIPYPHVVTIKK